MSDSLHQYQGIHHQHPISSKEPLFIAGECFAETLIEFGIDDESADNARKAFLDFNKDQKEQTHECIEKIACQVAQSVKRKNKKNFPKMHSFRRNLQRI